MVIMSMMTFTAYVMLLIGLPLCFVAVVKDG